MKKRQKDLKSVSRSTGKLVVHLKRKKPSLKVTVNLSSPKVQIYFVWAWGAVGVGGWGAGLTERNKFV